MNAQKFVRFALIASAMLFSLTRAFQLRSTTPSNRNNLQCLRDLSRSALSAPVKFLDYALMLQGKRINMRHSLKSK